MRKFFALIIATMMIVGMMIPLTVLNSSAEEPILGFAEDFVIGTTEQDSVTKDTITFIGTIKKSIFDNADELYDFVTMTLVFSGGDLTSPKTISHDFTKVYSTLTSVASTNSETAAAQGSMFIDDDSVYLFALSIVGIVPGRYTVAASVTPNKDGAALEEEKAEAEFETAWFKADGSTADWSAAQKANALKGWYEDSEGRTRGLEYMAYTDDDFVYLYTRSVTASNADKGLDIIFNKDSNRLASGLWLDAPGENVVDYYFAPNVALENGLYESVSEVVLNKAPYINSQGNVYLGVWFIGCDDGFAPLSWHEDGKTTIWGLNHRCPWNVAMSHQKVTEDGFDHYHYLDENGVCGWCQETVTLPITLDGDCSDWDAAILSTGRTADNGKNKIFAVGYTDDENLYLYIELTQHTDSIPNYITVFCKNSQTDGIRTTENFAQYYDDWNPLRPWCQGSWACAYYADCDDGYTARSMRKTTDGEGNPVTCLELVINKEVASAPDGSIRIEVQIDDIATWSSGQTLSGWALIPVTADGFGG